MDWIIFTLTTLTGIITLLIGFVVKGVLDKLKGFSDVIRNQAKMEADILKAIQDLKDGIK